jgi:CubicO group peptidase (beta-lactamase class C family)
MQLRCRFVFSGILALGGACAQEPAETEQLMAVAAVAGEPETSSVVSLPAVSDAELDAAVAAVPKLSSFLLFQRDRLLRESYANGAGRDRPINIKSASKSILNALTGIALEQGYLGSLDVPISRYLPGYFAGVPAGDPRHSITIRHLVTMSSGLPSTSIRNYGAWVTSRDWVAYALSRGVENPPGSYMTYSTGDSHLLAAVLTEATGMPLREFAQRFLFGPAGMRAGGWDRDPQGIYFGGNNLALSPASMLNFGRLYLGKGEFNGNRVLQPEWVDESWQPRFLNSSFNMRHDYGYLWWHTRFAGFSAWFAWGYGGQFLFVVPELEAVVVLTGDPDSRTRGNNALIYDLMEDVIVPWLKAKREDDRQVSAGAGVATSPPID